MWSELVLFLFVLFELDLSVQQILVMVNNEQTSAAGVESSPKREQNLTVLRHSSYNVTVFTNESSIELHNDSSDINERTSINSSDIASVGSSEPSSVYSASTADPIAGNRQQQSPPLQQANLTTTEASTPTGRRFITCPHYLDKKDGRKETSDLVRYTFGSAIGLCNTSSRVGCRYSDFLRQIVNCAKSEHFTIDDIKHELSENKDLHELPRETEESPVLGYISFKVMNIDAVSVKDMDFNIDFYMGKFNSF